MGILYLQLILPELSAELAGIQAPEDLLMDAPSFRFLRENPQGLGAKAFIITTMNTRYYWSKLTLRSMTGAIN